MKTVRVGISGASGRMGRKLLEAAYTFEKSGVVLAAALEYTGHELLGTSATSLAGQFGVRPATEKPILLSDSFNPESVDVMIDFSTPAAAVARSKECRQHKIPLVVGVTAFSEAEKKELEAASEYIPLLISPNMSFGMLSMFNIVRQMTSLSQLSDVAICETHHSAKKDAPSGTALRLSEIIAEAHHFKNEIDISSIRAGDIVGEHRVVFASTGEQIEIIHRSTDRITYAFGALFAAVWLIENSKPLGLYSMEDLVKKD